MCKKRYFQIGKSAKISVLKFEKVQFSAFFNWKMCKKCLSVGQIIKSLIFHSHASKNWVVRENIVVYWKWDFKKTLQNLTTLFGEILTLDLTFVCT